MLIEGTVRFSSASSASRTVAGRQAIALRPAELEHRNIRNSLSSAIKNASQFEYGPVEGYGDTGPTEPKVRAQSGEGFDEPGLKNTMLGCSRMASKKLMPAVARSASLTRPYPWLTTLQSGRWQSRSERTPSQSDPANWGTSPVERSREVKNRSSSDRSRHLAHLGAG